MDYPKVCLRRGEEAGVLKGQKLIYDNELDWADDICIDGCVVDVLDSRVGRRRRSTVTFSPAASARRGRRGRRWAFPTRAGWSSASRTGCRG